MYYLTLEGSTDSTFATGTTITIPVLGVSTFRAPLGELFTSWGHRQKHSTTWVRRFVVDCFPFKVATNATNDYGDLIALEDVLYMPYLRIRRTGTDLPRTNGTNDFWTHGTTGLLSNGDGSENPMEVARVAGPDVSPDPNTGTDKVTFTLEATLPMV